MESRGRGVLDTRIRGYDDPVWSGEVRAMATTLTHPAHYKRRRICYGSRAPRLSTGAGSNVMAKGQMRSNKEKKKPKADKNLKKGGATPSPFSSGKIQMQAGQNPYNKKS
jgi:hypothetical protein